MKYKEDSIVRNDSNVFSDLYDWYSRMFDTFGWMILRNDKTERNKYRNEIVELENRLRQKANEYRSGHTKKILIILANNTRSLLEHVDIIFNREQKSSLVDGARKPKSKSIKPKSKSKSTKKTKKSKSNKGMK